MGWYDKIGKEDDTVISTRIRLSRNLDKIPFPSRMSREQSEEVLKAVSDALLSRTKEFTLYRMDDLSDTDKRALLEEHLISRELLDNRLSRGVLINKERTVSVMVNEEDHIRLQCILPGFEPEETFSIADKTDTLIGESVTYAFHEKLGYLSSCPTNVGTGMRASAMIHLPALTLTGNLNNLLNSVGKLGMTIRGLYGEGTEAQGNLYQISNQRTLGMTEEELLSRFTSVITQLMEKERSVRTKLSERGDLTLIDRVERAWGILTNARLLSGKEFMNLYSDVRLGKSMGILTEGPAHTTNLLVLTQPATLSRASGKALTAAQRDARRAELVRNYLKGVNENG